MQSPKWNYYLQGADIIVRNDHKPLTKFLNGKNANNKVNRWGLELAPYSITFKWISGACNKAADCLSQLVNLPQDKLTVVNMLSATYQDGPAFNTRSQTLQHHFSDDLTSHTQPDVPPDVTDATGPTPKSLTEEDCRNSYKCRKQIHSVKEYPNALVIPKAWRYTVLVEAHDQAWEHQGTTCTYCLIKCQYYWKGMNKDMRKYIANCALSCREKAEVQAKPLQMTEILE